MAVKAPSMAETTGRQCPVCRAPSAHATRPFCSRRCADIDLARWLGGGYVIAGSNALADEDATTVRGAADPANAKDSEDEGTG